MIQIFTASLLNHMATAAPGAHVNCGETGGCDTGLPQVDASQLTNILQVVFAVLGGVALIIVLLGAFQFITANGDSQGVAKARNTIIYAAIGLAVCVSADVIVTYVISSV